MSITLNVEGVGEVQMVGRGPWRVRSNSGSSHEIVDADNRIANPTVVQKFSVNGSKPNANVTWARLSYPTKVVEAANAALEDQPVETPVEEPIVEEAADETPAETDADTDSESTEA